MAQLSSSITTPPPRATTAPGCSARGSTFFSNSRKAGSPAVAKRSAIDMPASCSTMWSRSKSVARERSATNAPTRVLPDPMKPSKASGFGRWLDAAWVGGNWRRGGRSRRHAAPSLLRLHEDLVAEVAWLRQVIEHHFGALCPGGVDLHPSVVEDAADQRLLRAAVLDAGDRDDPLLPAEDS